MNMKWKMLKNDYKRNRAGNTALLLFMTLAAGLVVVATIVVTQLIASMTQMYQTAKPPHFLQMHKGAVNENAIDDFVSSYDGAIAWQAPAMIDVFGDDLKVYGKEKFSLSDCRLDISLVKQNKDYDLLLDANRSLSVVNNGEIGIPVILLDAYPFHLGDKVVLTNNGVTKEFIVSAFVHDAQMNSTLCSSTRMLISDKDFNELFGKVGEPEYLIEVYFTDKSMASAFQTAYEKAGLPQDGQAVTYTIIFLLSAFRDISMAFILILVSMLLVMIALMCVKYTIMAALEEEINEIGTMKAIGMSHKDVRNLYLQKYQMLTAAGIVLGYIIALILSGLFTGHVSSTFGAQPVSILTIGLPIVSCLLIYLIAYHYCRRILKKLKKVTVVDALVTRNGFGKKERVKDGLYRSKILPVNLLLSVRETLHNFGGFRIVFAIMFIVSGIMIVPVNLLNTMKSKEFISYMGSSDEDIIIEVDAGANLDKNYETIKNILTQDSDIKEYHEFRSVRVEALDSKEQWMNLHIDSGNNAGEGLKYLEGKAPAADNEIALSKLNADTAGKKTGDRLIIRYNDNQQEFVISGVYQDVTSGGCTAKAVYAFPGMTSEKYQLTVNLVPGTNVLNKAALWKEESGSGSDILPMQEYINQTLGGVSRQVEIAVIAVVIIGIALSALLVVLFMKLRLAKDMAQIAAMKAIGFADSDIRKQYLYKISMVSVIGIAAGTVISNFVGENIVSGAFGMMGFGITKVTFIINPWIAFVLIPVILLAVAAGMTLLSSRQIKGYNIISLINE